MSRGVFKVSVQIVTPTGEQHEMTIPELGPRAGVNILRIMTVLLAHGDLAFCPCCELVGGEHHLSCVLVNGEKYPCNAYLCKNHVSPQKGIERSGWFYCGADCADSDTHRRVDTLRKEHVPREKWCAFDIDAGTYRGPGST